MIKCCLCGGDIKVNPIGWDGGNNPSPLMEDTEKNPNRCCDDCNVNKVIPARLSEVASRSSR